jgi:hypothetical protein
LTICPTKYLSLKQGAENQARLEGSGFPLNRKVGTL